RRRHTRFSRDWSSDVCSSDLCSAWHKGPETRISAAVAGNGVAVANTVWVTATEYYRASLCVVLRLVVRSRLVLARWWHDSRLDQDRKSGGEGTSVGLGGGGRD